MKKVIGIFSLLILASCGNDKNADGAAIELKSEKDSLSYSFGAEQIRRLSSDPNFKSMDKKLLEKGFIEGLTASSTVLDPVCKETLQKLFGPYGQDFEIAYAKEGSKCIGNVMAYEYIKFLESVNGKNQVNIELVGKGFAHILNSKDTLISFKQRNTLITDFITKMNAGVAEKNKSTSTAMMEKAQSLPNTKVLENGIIIETITAGTGGSPTAADDVEADYILTNSVGDTMESSFEYRKAQGSMEKPKFNLGGVIQGWRDAFPNLKKGGKYRLYIPAELAYGDQKGALCFYIEFSNFGKAGSLVKPQAQPAGM
ncbi:MAG: FKBP-type peptidyl-prolyl cis-trans isomerase [Flavobacteriia bacterium]|nr:FKBP-type peptidyl-prolyl cis-trans isomerase [Flavobacteriia bacterium]